MESLQEKILIFQSVSGLSEEQCRDYLQRNGWDLEVIKTTLNYDYYKRNELVNIRIFSIFQQSDLMKHIVAITLCVF